MDYFDELSKKFTLFLDESKLDMNLVPEHIPNREKELSLLSQLFLNLITNPNSLSRRILIIGPPGVGKSAIVKSFGKMLVSAAEKRSIPIEYVHVNCRKERSVFKVLIKIMRSLDESFPKRGFSPQELLEKIFETLKTQNMHFLVAIDEMSYLITKNFDFLSYLLQINDDSLDNRQYISIICIERDLLFLNKYLDDSTIQSLLKNTIRFEPYSEEQIFDILKSRVRISLKKDVISDSLLKDISRFTFKTGDIRLGINLLWKTAKIAEIWNLKRINSDCFNRARQDGVPI